MAQINGKIFHITEDQPGSCSTSTVLKHAADIQGALTEAYALIANLILQTRFVSLVIAVGRTVLFKAEKSSHSLQMEASPTGFSTG